MKTVVLYNIISFIILIALIFVLRIVSKSNLRQILYLIFDYPHKHYTFKYFEV